MFRDLIQSTRSYRRFRQEQKIAMEDLLDLVDTGRYAPSGGNLQPLRFRIVCDEAKCQTVFETLKWAAYFTDWEGPEEGQRPVAYILICGEEGKSTGNEEGLRQQAMVLAAMEKGIGSCILANVDRKMLKAKLEIPDPYEIRQVIALGYPAEEIVTEDIAAGDSIRYYRDAEGIHHVPKIRLEDQLI